ncbi:MAG: MBL fold metallo-hydrolase [Patescibacteria group bacterium]
MNITKFGHCCLLIEEAGARLLTDPGNYNNTPDVRDIDAILITHEHQDHIHMPALKVLLAENPRAIVITHEGVGKLLDAEHIPYQPIADGGEILIKNISVKSVGHEHACIHKDIALIQNTGFLIAGKLFYPGDALYNPGVPVEVLALPVSAPWLKLAEAVDYARAIKPKKVFPVHDGMLRQDHRLGPTRFVPKTLLEPLGIEYVDMIEGSVAEF